MDYSIQKTERLSKGMGLLLKIVGLSSIFVLLAILVLAIMSILNMRALSLETAVQMGKNKLKGDIAIFERMLTEEYGHLRVENGQLLDERDAILNVVVDRISSMLGIVATVFIRDADDYRRISTNVTNNSGQRIVNTFLGSNSAAYGPVNAGETYIGNAVILGKDYLTAYQPIFAQNTKDVIGILFIGIEMSSIKNAIKNSSTDHIITIIIIAAVILLVSILLNTLSTWIVLLKPIRSTVGMLKDISEGEGDITKELTVASQDEIRDMAHYFNLTLEKIRNLIMVIKKQSLTLVETGDELAVNMNNTAGSIHHIIQNIQTINEQVTNQSASVIQTNVSMGEIIDNINTLNTYIDRQSVSVTESSAGIEEMVANIRSVTKTLIANAGNVSNLAEASEAGKLSLQETIADIQEIARESAGLLEINEVMENIASQTNLLSMNAAIEAAHAGEAGKGFAVVADEIRKLAESSKEQSATISEVLNNIKTSIDKIILSTDTVLQRFEAIDGEIKTVSKQEETIRNAMEEQGAGSRQILESIAQLNTITQMVRTSSREMHGRSKEVIQECEALGKVTKELNKGMGAVTAEVNHINYAVTQVNTISTENKENIDSLVHEVSRFRIE